MAIISKDQYLNTVANKLNECRDALQYGVLGRAGGELRDDYGVEQCFSNILDTASNTYDMNVRMYDGARCESVADTLANFSGVGYADVSNVQTVGKL